MKKAYVVLKGEVIEGVFSTQHRADQYVIDIKEDLKVEVFDVDEFSNNELFGGKRWTGGKQSKIPEHTKFMIRQLYNTGRYTQANLAKIYKVSQVTVCNILKEVK